MANRAPSLKKNRLSSLLVISLLCLLGAYFVLRAWIPQKPALFAQAHSPSAMQWHDGVWYWLEGAGTPQSRLIQANASGAHSIAEGDQINAYASAGKKAAWSAQGGKQWSVTLAAADGSGKQTLWRGEREPHGLCFAEGRIFWLEENPPVLPDSGPMPPLGGSVNVVSLPVTGGTPTVIATLLEPKGQQVLGVHDGQIYVQAFRPGTPACTLLYRVPISGGASSRIAGESGQQQALLLQDGTLYWTADSQEATDSDKVACIRRIKPGGQPEALADWLPAHGTLYATDHGVCYVDGSFRPMAWPLAADRELPRAVPLSENYVVLAAGDGEILVKSANSLSSDIGVYRMALP